VAAAGGAAAAWYGAKGTHYCTVLQCRYYNKNYESYASVKSTIRWATWFVP
jgi:hypothetical protein